VKRFVLGLIVLGVLAVAWFGFISDGRVVLFENVVVEDSWDNR
jgi:hypothetical protein